MSPEATLKINSTFRPQSLSHCKQHTLENDLNTTGVRYSSSCHPYADVPIPDSLLHGFQCGLTGRSYTFSKLRELCKKFAAALLKSGLKPGQVVALILPNTPDYPSRLWVPLRRAHCVHCHPAYTQGDLHQDVLPAILPFFHIYGFVIIMMSSLRHGGKLVTLPRFEPNSFINVLETQKSSVLYIVPPIVLFLGSHPAITEHHVKHMRIITSGAAPAGASDIERCFLKMPKSFIFMQAYGLTETSPVCLLPRNTNKNLSTVGAPTSITKAKIIDTSTGKILGPNEHGELCIYGPQVMQGYLNNPKATEETIRDGWLHTGDIGYYDDEGLFYIVDRLKELIKVKGFQVAPAELEELLRTHPKVSDVAVIGGPMQIWGSALAYVIRKEDVTEDELKTTSAIEWLHSNSWLELSSLKLFLKARQEKSCDVS
ncbi:hypothetical protein LSTR_LSTR015865 [Laodelphax striatellus]|uniref:AMP-dependent synthetase/ligase domain-containing protein n=1 Tax=Laodelphax striatellus TaxID=195883 RepID=A0A482XL45_LAOST|nr:hypothetical protein LSTR_LSTR015865 [Laodelphax striatellus]